MPNGTIPKRKHEYNRQNEENQLEPNSNCSSGLDFEARAKVHISRELMITILHII